MPNYWYDFHAVNKIEDYSERDFQRSIVADRKPYFMIYIYPNVKKEYRTFQDNVKKNSYRYFNDTIDNVIALPDEERTAQMNEFIRHYNRRMPVGMGNCVMNRICWRFEDRFDGCIKKYNEENEFDYTIMRSDCEYTSRQFYAIKKLYDEFVKRQTNYRVFVDYEKVDKVDSSAEIDVMKDEFQRECSAVCSNEDMLCNIILDICYRKMSTRKFAWAMCGHTIIRNLLRNCGGMISYPVKDENGEVEFGGNRFTIMTKKVEAEDEYSVEGE